MITAKNIHERLTAQPFRPFRICLSDGKEYELPHPDFAWVVGNRVFVAFLTNGDTAEDPHVREISDLHVTRLEDIAKPRKRKRAE